MSTRTKGYTYKRRRDGTRYRVYRRKTRYSNRFAGIKPKRASMRRSYITGFGAYYKRLEEHMEGLHLLLIIQMVELLFDMQNILKMFLLQLHLLLLLILSIQECNKHFLGYQVLLKISKSGYLEESS